MLKDFLQGRFMNHPLHPILVHLPIGLWVASFVFDIIFLASGNPNIALVSYYMMIGGLVGAALAILPGLADYMEIPSNTRPKTIATTHFILNGVVTVLYIVNLVTRYQLDGMIPTRVTLSQFILSLISVFALGISGYLGGLLVYDYGIGFKPQKRMDTTKKEDMRKVA